MSDTSPAPQTRSMRLIFEYDGDDVRLVMQQPVDLPATDVAASPAQQAGYFVDTRDASGRTLARVAARGAFPDSVEVFPERQASPSRACPWTGRAARSPSSCRCRRTPIMCAWSRSRPPQGDATQPTSARQSSPPARAQERESPGSRFRSAVEGEQPCPPQTARSSDRPRSSAAHPATARSIVVLLAEGFTAAQQADFNAACGEFVTAFRATPPFDELSPAHQHLPGERQLDRFRCR